MAKIIADPMVKIVPLPRTRPPSPASRLDTEMYRVMESVARKIYRMRRSLPSMSRSQRSGPTARQGHSVLRRWPRIDGRGRAELSRARRRGTPRGVVTLPFVQHVWSVVSEIAAQVSYQFQSCDRSSYFPYYRSPKSSDGSVAGTTTASFGGDGGPATSAWIQARKANCCRCRGNFYFADTRNIRSAK